MSQCPSCGAEIRGQKKFCGVCGGNVEASLGGGGGPTSGLSSIRLDADGINMLLREFSTPARQMSFQKGRLLLAQGPLQGALGLQLGPNNLDAQVTYTGGMGAIQISLEQLQLDEQGLEVKIRLSR